MIKYFCDKCGKEIVGNVNMIAEETEAVDCHDNIVMKWHTETHICDECQYSELTCGFKVGDEVITSKGRVGKIIDICTCDECKERGFYEPEVEFDDGDTDYIMMSAKRNGFKYFYKIGDQIFGNLDDSDLIDRLIALRDEMKKLETQLNVINKLRNTQPRFKTEQFYKSEKIII